MQSQLFSPRAEDEIFFISMPITARTAANWRGRKDLAPPMLFAQEFEGEFIDAESSAFSSEMIELALVDDFERFVQ